MGSRVGLVAGLVIALAVLGTRGPAPAAAQYLGGGTMTAHEAQVADLEQMQEKLVSLARAFPPEARDWRPMEGVRSVRDVVALIAAEGALFPTLWGYDAPEWLPGTSFPGELGRLAELPFEALVADMDRGLAHAIDLVGGMSEAERTRTVRFFGLEVPLGTAVTLMANDMHEHLGQLIAYARTNQVVPPWSQGGG